MIKLRRLILAGLLFVTGLAHADWATDRAGSAGYVTVTTLASVIDEAVPFCVVYLSDMPAGFWTAMDAAGDTDGHTIRTASADGSTQLPCVPLGVNTGTDTGCLIFLDTGSSESVNVPFRIYNGNAALSMPSASGGMGEQAVFAAYVAAYFPGMATRDFTNGGRTLTATGTPGTAASGYEGITAATYNGSTQFHKYDGTQCRSSWPITTEALAYSTDLSSNQSICALTYSGSNNNYAYTYFNGLSTDGIAADFKGSAGSTSTSATSTDYSSGTWHYAATSRTNDTGTGKAYIDGGNSGSDSSTISAPTAFDRLGIGALRINAGDFGLLTGRVAWVGITSSEQTANYIATQHQNWLGNLYSVGSWTPNSVAPGTTGWVLFQTAATTSASGSLVDWTNVNNALVDDANYASASLDNGGNYETEYLNLTNPAYGVTVPTGAPSYTVEFRIKRKRDSGGGHRIDDLTVQFIDDTSTRVGTNLALTANWPTTAATQDYTLAGYTPDGTEFTSAAGLAIRATAINAAGLSEADVLVAWIKVSWTGTDTLAGTRGFFALTE